MDENMTSQGNTSTKMVEKGKGYKCLPAIDRADKVIHSSNEALANSMPQSHPWVKFITH